MAPAPAPAPVPAAAPARPVYSADSYGPVRRGETLWSIADRVRPGGVSIQSMMLALLDANREVCLDHLHRCVHRVHQMHAGRVAAIAIEARAFAAAVHLVVRFPAAVGRALRDQQSAHRSGPGRAHAFG